MSKLTKRLGLFSRATPLPRDRRQQKAEMIWNWVIQLLIAVVVSVVSYLIQPKPKTPKPDSNRDFDNPTASAGRPCTVVFGTVRVKGLNILWYGDKGRRDYEVKA